MAGIIPLTNHEPAKAPTKNKIIIGTKTLFQFSQTSATIVFKETLFLKPTNAVTKPPINKMY